MNGPRRIPPAECTEHPWWAILDPARVSLPHPEDVGGIGPCEECGAEADDDCTQTEDEDNPGEQRRSPHDGRPDYRSALTSEDVSTVVSGPYFSREAAEAYLRAKKHRFSDRARVWCLGGHESADWRAFCKEPPPDPDRKAPGPPLAKTHTGMRVDATGVLGRLVEFAANVRKLYVDQDATPDPGAVNDLIRDNLNGALDGWAAGELLRTLQEAAASYYAGNVAVADEFFQLWCLDDARPKETS